MRKDVTASGPSQNREMGTDGALAPEAMSLSRRRFLAGSAATALASTALPGCSLWLSPRLDRVEPAGSDPRADGPAAADRVAGEPAAATPGSGDPLLVAIFLRGAADSLSLLIPAADPQYRELRGRLAVSGPIALPEGFESRLVLDNAPAPGFALHPSLAPLQPWVARGEVAFVPSAGSPHPTRSHFEAQDFMEAGQPGVREAGNGWLARALGEPEHPLSALALAQNAPIALRGSGALTLDGTDGLGLWQRHPRAVRALEWMYGAGARGRRSISRSGSDPVTEAGLQALVALRELETALAVDSGVGGSMRGRRKERRARKKGGGKGRGYGSLAATVETLVQLDRRGVPLRAVHLESPNWDTHQNQGADAGSLANRAADLGTALATLERELRPRRRLVVVVMTEFGRTARPNGSNGTDHGHGSFMLVAGHGIRGGCAGVWRGLASESLYEGRDLEVTTDFRDVLSEAVRSYDPACDPASVFPSYRPGAGVGLT